MITIKKKGRSRKFDFKPFPIIAARGYFTGLDVEIFDEKSIEVFHESGCYGLNPKPRQAVNATDPLKGVPQSLVLFLEEAFFLHQQLNCLEILDLYDSPIPTQSLWKSFCKLKPTFVECYVSYLYMKSKNWVIKSGIKFGGEFLLYKHSPQHFHATYIVIISTTGTKNPLEYHTNERIAETTGKNLLYLEVLFPENANPDDLLDNLESFTVKEVCIRRKEISNKV